MQPRANAITSRRYNHFQKQLFLRSTSPVPTATSLPKTLSLLGRDSLGIFSLEGPSRHKLTYFHQKI